MGYFPMAGESLQLIPHQNHLLNAHRCSIQHSWSEFDASLEDFGKCFNARIRQNLVIRACVHDILYHTSFIDLEAGTREALDTIFPSLSRVTDRFENMNDQAICASRQVFGLGVQRDVLKFAINPRKT